MLELDAGGDKLIEKIQKSLKYKKEVEEAMKANEIEEQMDRARSQKVKALKILWR